MKKKQPTSLLPEEYEVEAMQIAFRIFSELEEYVVQIVEGPQERKDSRSLLFLLGLTTESIISRERLEQRLRRLARDLEKKQKRKLSELIGVVGDTNQATIEAWVQEQADAILLQLDDALVAAAAETTATLGAGASLLVAGKAVRGVLKGERQKAMQKASTLVLSLNAAIIEEVARGGNSTHYRWITERDGKVRDHHRALDGQIFQWTTPPLGGGTRSGDYGHPGSGINCRCFPQPFAGAIPPFEEE